MKDKKLKGMHLKKQMGDSDCFIKQIFVKQIKGGGFFLSKRHSYRTCEESHRQNE